jgi:signal transduction histidine kinase
VIDTGMGIASDALPRVFDRFWQIDTGARRGLGLGLYICKQIIEQHGGHISAESVPGVGTTLRFTLPTG